MGFFKIQSLSVTAVIFIALTALFISLVWRVRVRFVIKELEHFCAP